MTLFSLPLKYTKFPPDDMSFFVQQRDSSDKMIRRTRSMKLLVFFICVVTVLMLVLMNKQQPIGEERLTRSLKFHAATIPKVEKFKLFHLDLKGAPPKISYLLQILPLVRKAGANGLLIEYEDMFPWEGIVKNISAGNAYSKLEIQSLVEMAKSLNMEVIPLVQTFGHLEFMLKLKEFQHLRELDAFPQEICPSNVEAIHIVKEMIDQMMALHAGVRYLHVGCDEVYHISACSTCSKKHPRDIFISHVTSIGEYVRGRYPGVTPIIWDDMMRHWSPDDFEESELGKIVEPMVWVYIEDINRLVPNFVWYAYKKTFPKIWAASAFKGAYGEKEIVPDLPRHIENHLAWLRIMNPNNQEDNLMKADDFKGIALTGWSRYDHFAVLAELLPIALPSLTLNLALVHAYLNTPQGKNVEASAFKSMYQVLNCPDNMPYHSIGELRADKFQWAFATCVYPGSNLYLLISQLFNLQARLNVVLGQKYSNGWVSEYNIKHNFSSPYRVIELYPEEGFAAQQLKKAAGVFKEDAKERLSEYYDKYTVNEWLEQKVGPIEDSLNEMEKMFQKLVEIKTWPRRPLT